MADLDRDSSPDPLLEDLPPSSVPRTISRSSTKVPRRSYDRASLSKSVSSAARRSSSIQRATSPRKQMFELDVGKDGSPQRLFVTVEAEEDMNGSVKRRLWLPSSPSRNVSTEETLTKMVPLRGLTDDEGDGNIVRDKTPKPRRGRPRRESNGTPMPRKKRNGTPLQRSEKTARRKTNLSSEIAIPSSEAVDDEPDWDAAGATPKPTRRPRKSKSPKKAPTPTTVASTHPPSSQPTGRKRGRPRKAMIPEEVAVLTEPDDKVGMAMSENGLIDEVLPSLEADMTVAPAAQTETHVDPPQDDGQGGMESSATPTPANRNSARINEPMEEIIEEAVSQDVDQAMDDDYGYENEPMLSPQGASPEADAGINLDEIRPAEHQSDAVSEFEGVTHPSEFSEIGFESLPSFQASFQGKASGMSAAPALADETSPILNQTLASLRQSTRNENGQQSPAPALGDGEALEDRFDPSSPHSRASDANAPSSPDGGLRSSRMSSKPRRSLPLSRQIFAAKSSPHPSSHHDDSFSSVPESILEAATPRRPKAQARAIPETNQNDEEDEGGYDDSFSEIPDDVLEAATPGRRTAGMKFTVEQHTAPSSPVSRLQGPSAGDTTTSSNKGSSRLPTPEKTSNKGSKKDQGGFLQVPSGPALGSSSSQHNMPSSPPNIARTYNHDINTSDIPHNLNQTPEEQESSPQLPPSAVAASERDRSAEPHVPSRRPTLSPIVRVGRTLQSVISDRSSPADRESSLGSPFRGSVANDHSRQSSVAKSPTEGRNNAGAAFQNGLSSFNPIASFTKSIAASFRQSQGQIQPERNTAENATHPFGSSRRDSDHGQPGSLGKSMHIRQNSQGDGSIAHQRRSRSRDVPSSDHPMSWVAEGSPKQIGAGTQAKAPSVNVQASDLSVIQGSRSDANSVRDANLVQENAQEEDTQLQTRLEEESQHGHEPDQDDDDIDAAEVFMDDAADEPEQDEPEHEPIANTMNDMASEGDLWDIEASRPDTSAISDAKPLENIGSRQGRTSSSPWRKNSRRLIYQDKLTSPTQIEMDENFTSEPENEGLYASRQQESSLSPSRRSERTIEARRQAGKSKSPAPPQDLPAEEEAEDEAEEEMEDNFDDDGYDGVDNGAAQDMDDDDMDQYSMVPTSHSKPKDATENDEYSMLASVKKPQDTPNPEKKKPGFFGGFDIMSFFSSPATLPNGNTAMASRDGTKTLSQIKFSNPVPSVNQPKPPMYSTGMFPSVPQRQFQPSPERRRDLFSSPGDGLRSGGTVADTYAATSSPRLSTPERQVFPSVEQKRNFTPRPGQSAGSLFNSSRPSTPSQPNNNRLQIQRDDPESSIMTEESEYERVPPREKPSHWDKTLSPSKSCFRSPLKPSTPGRVVAFSNNTKVPFLPFGAQAGQQQVNGSMAHGVQNSIPQIPIVQQQQQQQQQEPISNGKENRVTFSTTTMEQRSSNQRRGAGPSGPRPVFLSPKKQLQHVSRLSPAPPSLRSPSQNNLTTSALPPRGSGISNNNNNSDMHATTNEEQIAVTHGPPAPAAAPAPAPAPRSQTNPPLSSSAVTAVAGPTPPTITTTTTNGVAPKWTKDHWMHLCQLADLRRREPLGFGFKASLPPRDERSASRALLGREVTSQGEKMLVEAWHMDVVDAFGVWLSDQQEQEQEQDEYDDNNNDDDDEGQWRRRNRPFDEKYITRRLFAIIAKEERDKRRRRGRRSKGRSDDHLDKRGAAEGGGGGSSEATVSIASGA